MRQSTMVGPLLAAQSVESGGAAGWLIIGGALVVLTVGLVMVFFARSSRREEVDDRIAVRSEAPEEVRPAPVVPRERPRSGATFVDLPRRQRTGHVDIRIGQEIQAQGRRSPMSAFDPDVEGEPRETFIDLPTSGSVPDPVIDLNDELVDLTEKREKAAPKRDPLV
ncbi:MAG: hypothetical protein P1T08_05230 [Acidimicrobiia bacterium]|nr:hypothetical protein [Acidimicrobiia bacterium]